MTQCWSEGALQPTSIANAHRRCNLVAAHLGMRRLVTASARTRPGGHVSALMGAPEWTATPHPAAIAKDALGRIAGILAVAACGAALLADRTLREQPPHPYRCTAVVTARCKCSCPAERPPRRPRRVRLP